MMKIRTTTPCIISTHEAGTNTLGIALQSTKRRKEIDAVQVFIREAIRTSIVSKYIYLIVRIVFFLLNVHSFYVIQRTSIFKNYSITLYIMHNINNTTPIHDIISQFNVNKLPVLHSQLKNRYTFIFHRYFLSPNSPTNLQRVEIRDKNFGQF